MSLPLDGVVVVELGGIGPAPFACGILADMGATVVRIERPSGDGLPGGLTGIGVRNRIVVELDLRKAEGRAVVETLARSADILIEGFRPGAAERLGLGPEELRGVHPGLVYVRMTGWGQSGPRATSAGHDINYVSTTGVLAAIGGPDQPVPPLNLVGDYGGGAMFAVAGALAGLVARDRTGIGCVVDAAMVDGVSALASPIRELLAAGLWTERRAANPLDGGAPFYRTYPTADGRFVAVGAIEEPFYEQLLSGLGLDPAALPDRIDPRSWPELTDVLAGAFATRTRDEWALVFEGTDACVTPVLTFTEAVSDPHAQARSAFVSGEAGPTAAPAPRFAGAGDPPKERRADASASDTLVALGCSEAVVEALEASGALRSV